MRMELKSTATFNWASALRGVRNPLQSWIKSDSAVDYEKYDFFGTELLREKPFIGENDLKLCRSLALAGGCHPKFLRQIMISTNIVAPLLWWVEFDTYKVGTVANSTSKMFKLGSRELTREDLDLDTWDEDDDIMLAHVNKLIKRYIELKDVDSVEAKTVWRKLNQIVPSSFVYERTVTLNYEVLRSVYRFRHLHKLVEWKVFLEKMVKEIPYGQEFIVDWLKGVNDIEYSESDKVILDLMNKGKGAF